MKLSVLFTLLLTLSAVGAAAADRPVTADELLQQSRAKYAALKTYADTGVIVTESKIGTAPAIRERHTFNTYYRAPRQFFFDFREDAAAGADRLVIWMDGAELNTWWLTTGAHQVFPKGQGAIGFAVATLPTKGSAVQIAPLLFSGAGLHGPLADLKNARLSGSEQIDGRKHYRISGQVGLAYGTGTVTSTRPTTIWIDAETLLVRKVLEETQSNALPNVIDQVTTTFSPVADPELKASAFQFSVPEKK